MLKSKYKLKGVRAYLSKKKNYFLDLVFGMTKILETHIFRYFRGLGVGEFSIDILEKSQFGVIAIFGRGV